jgi:peptide/nickel transport system permease protein
MLRYIGKRVLQFIPVFFGVTLILFLISNFMPGVDPVQIRVGERRVDPQLRAVLEREFGLDQPWYIQYKNYMVSLAQGDLGNSMNGRTVTSILADKYPNTLRLAAVAILFQAVMGIGAGIISALKRKSFLDVVVTLSTSMAVSLPVFWVGVILQYVFGIWMREVTGGAFFMPISGMSGQTPAIFGPNADWVFFIMPAFTLACVSTAYTARIMRSQLLEIKNMDFVRTAKAKGLSGTRILWGHQMKNAMIPVITYIGIDFGAMLAGALLTETVFNWPGIGRELYLAILRRDFQVVIGTTTVILVMVMIINLIVDICYAFLDPRIRIGGTEE